VALFLPDSNRIVLRNRKQHDDDDVGALRTKCTATRGSQRTRTAADYGLFDYTGGLTAQPLVVQADWVQILGLGDTAPQDYQNTGTATTYLTIPAGITPGTYQLQATLRTTPSVITWNGVTANDVASFSWSPTEPVSLYVGAGQAAAATTATAQNIGQSASTPVGLTIPTPDAGTNAAEGAVAATVGGLASVGAAAAISHFTKPGEEPTPDGVGGSETEMNPREAIDGITLPPGVSLPPEFQDGFAPASIRGPLPPEGPIAATEDTGSAPGAPPESYADPAQQKALADGQSLSSPGAAVTQMGPTEVPTDAHWTPDSGTSPPSTPVQPPKSPGQSQPTSAPTPAHTPAEDPMAKLQKRVDVLEQGSERSAGWNNLAAEAGMIVGVGVALTAASPIAVVLGVGSAVSCFAWWMAQPGW